VTKDVQVIFETVLFIICSLIQIPRCSANDGLPLLVKRQHFYDSFPAAS